MYEESPDIENSFYGLMMYKFTLFKLLLPSVLNNDRDTATEFLARQVWLAYQNGIKNENQEIKEMAENFLRVIRLLVHDVGFLKKLDALCIASE